MKISAKPTEYLMIQAQTDSEEYDCDYAIVHINENWKEEMQTRLDMIKPFSESKNDLSAMDYFSKVYFYKDDNKINCWWLLGEQHWSFVTPDENDIEFLSDDENRRLGNRLEIQTDGWANYSTHDLYEDKYWTKEFSIEEIIDLLSN